jgi:tetratricopeptide (TPR) repeat protein
MQSYLLLALVEKRLGRFDQCFHLCERMLALDPRNEAAYEIKGDLFKTNLHIEEAFVNYSKAVQLNPASSSAISSLGDVLKFKGRL